MALAQRLGVAEECVVTTAGSVQLIELLLGLTCAGGRGEALSFAPCFPAFAHRAKIMGVEHRQVPLGSDFGMDLGALGQAVDERTRLVYVANPDNPTGRIVSRAELLDFARSLPKDTLLLVDEAYLDFADDPQAVSVLGVLDQVPHLGIIRTFSKAYGLAGARVGYGVLPVAIARELRTMQLPFAVSGPSIAGALAALTDEDFRRQSAELAREGRKYLQQELTRLGCEIVEGQGPFVMFRPQREAGKVFESLLKQGVAVRPLDYAGLPEWLRVSTGTQEDNEEFVKALGVALRE